MTEEEAKSISLLPGRIEEVIVCSKCQKENQDHYKFCLGCGTELSRDRANKSFASDTPPHGVPAAGDGGRKEASPQQPVAAQPRAAESADVAASMGVSLAVERPVEKAAGTGLAPPAARADGMKECPQCRHQNLLSSRFCASCGYNLAALQAAPQEPSGKQPVMLTALRADGTEAGSFPLPGDMQVIIGRDTGAIFAGDSYLSPKHACFVRGPEGLNVRDYNSLNGVYLRLPANAPWKLEFGDVFRIGQEIVRFEVINGQQVGDVMRLGSPSKGYLGRLALVIGRDTTGNAFPIPEGGAYCGRERGDILFSEDGYVSGLHCRIAPDQDGNVYLTDVGSSNGTFVRLKREHTLQNGAILLMGQQLFRVDL